jgi:MinD superfamily P-loop ATPase
MHEIVVLSGKGGTGKTSIAASLAMIASNDIVVADCDVDAANLHLLLAPDFAVTHNFWGSMVAEVDDDVCNLCGECEKICRFEAISLNEKMVRINEIRCEGCGYCEKVCKERAINLKKRICGKVYESTIKSGASMVHACLEPGGENSGKLVAMVKNEARQLLNNQNKDYLLVDGAPGIGCPVVSSLSGASLVLLVTEPALTALSDLKRLYQLLETLSTPAVCIINKCDIDTLCVENIKKFLMEKHIPLLAEIPYDNVFTHAMVNGKTMSEFDEKFKILCVNLWEGLKKRINKKKDI